MHPPLYQLSAIWDEHFDDSDYGKSFVCTTSEQIALSYDKDLLETMAAELRTGHINAFWTEERADFLRSLYPNYDDMRDTKYEIKDISDSIIAEHAALARLEENK